MVARLRVPDRLRDRRGAALIEFAITATLLLTLLFGISDMGRAWWARQVITQASREGARKGAIYNTTITLDSVRAATLRAVAAGGLDTSSTRLTINVYNWNGSTDTADTVQVRYWHRHTLLPLITGGVIPDSVQLTASSIFRNE